MTGTATKARNPSRKGKRKERSDDDSTQRVTISRPPMRLSTIRGEPAADTQGDSSTGLNEHQHDESDESEGEEGDNADSEQPHVSSLPQPLVTDRTSNIPKVDSRVMNQRMYEEVKARVKAETALSQALETIAAMKQAEKDRISTQGRGPIERPTISKEDAVNFRLTSPRTLLGLDLQADDRNDNKTLNPRGMLKDKSWKLLLMFSREVVTYGMQYLEVSESPDWKPLNPEVKRSLVKEFEGKVKNVPCLKALFFYGDRWDRQAELYVWRHSWPLKEMIKDTMDNIKDSNRNHVKIEQWCLEAMLQDPGPNDLVIEEWPPAPARELLTAVQHRPSDSESE